MFLGHQTNFLGWEGFCRGIEEWGRNFIICRPPPPTRRNIPVVLYPGFLFLVRNLTFSFPKFLQNIQFWIWTEIFLWRSFFSLLDLLRRKGHSYRDCHQILKFWPTEQIDLLYPYKLVICNKNHDSVLPFFLCIQGYSKLLRPLERKKGNPGA